MMDNCCAPQWTDLTCSPQVHIDNYFELEHSVHKPRLEFTPLLKSLTPHKELGIGEESLAETKFDDSLESETPRRPTPANVAYFIAHDNKKHPVEEPKKDGKATRDLNLDERSSKIHQTWSISVSEITTAFRASTASRKVKPILPERIRKSMRMSEAKNTFLGGASSKNAQTSKAKKGSDALLAVPKTETEPPEKSKVDDCPEENAAERRLSFKIVSAPRRRSGAFKSKRCSLGKSQPKVLTCQYRRRSLMKYRRCSNQFVSLAEAVSKFQNGTPQRFRTLCKKDLKPGPLLKLKRSPLKLTYPVSPALRCKQRTRQTTILSTQERERLELEEMKKHQIKAKPVPVNILKGPSVLKKVAKKPATITEEFRLTQPKKTRHTMGPQANSQQNEKETKNPAPMARSTSVSSVANKESNESKESASTTAEQNAKTARFSFGTRNKKFQLKKEEKLKSLHDQETNKAKPEFHARPAPKFLKVTTSSAKEQMAKKKLAVIPCPFSFEERNKSLAKKKEDLIKQIQEQNKKVRVFHANPVPTFKPVMVRGSSKENLRNKEKLHGSKELVAKQTKSCNDQENKQPNIIESAPISADIKKKATLAPSNKAEKKEIKSVAEATETKSDKLNASQKRIANFKLHSDKRAKERSEFDEKIRKKEQELEAKRVEEERSRLLKEKMERAELRKMTEIKARPMPVYKPPVVLKSSKPPTSPQSPFVRSRTKAKSVL